ncbi:MOSC domain-containing protein [Gordonia jinhuaensis]|uniref:MOSC domain-containing protein n=2 Tax=Gordonia jinhuaensis TaxID=1517702 RepID=A0A916WT74_9ACTN|nr:MOSC domain-containing protein [Gordonia jinhuaensis]
METTDRAPIATGRVLAVCAASTDVVLAGVGASGIDKRPLDGARRVEDLGLVDDHVVDHKHHGGIDQAVYAYSELEARRWADELGRELPPGWFGENLRIEGIETTDAIVGERWRVGDEVILEATIPRIPCRTFAEWAREAHWVKRFMDRADLGTYLLVRTPGSVAAGDRVEVISRPSHGVRVRDLATGTDPDKLRDLLAQGGLPAKVERDATKALRKSSM